MITKELVDRINYLARKQKNGGLTALEKKEQKALRELYLQNIRTQVTDTLGSMGLKPKKEEQEKHRNGCTCHNCNTRHSH